MEAPPGNCPSCGADYFYAPGPCYKCGHTNGAPAPQPQAPVLAGVADPDNRPTKGGMAEVDAAVIADLNGWQVVYKNYECSDRKHTPKGRLYTNGKGAYYGADNTGHVGWGFKIWSLKNDVLQYEGNLVWNGKAWQIVPRYRGG